MAEAKLRVLVVDDEPSVRRIAERVLEREGIEALSASDGDEALEIMDREAHLDLIVLDASMPRMSGERVLQIMRERGLSIPVVVSSGFGEDGLADADAYPNLRGFLAKPYRVATLAARVRELLGMPES
ncbi:response regulator [Pseudenhygromyxa sp. WMMC2535]|uniref:response regulator n=1 Tax=Pseudenhygromyxa sp. WMMC2535 TaxID=2712867 RepID=UPI0015520ABB|nr:response regulator [Pseudenhygromyxa sp. WMMC2535]